MFIMKFQKNQMKKYNSKSILIPGRSDHSFEEHRAIYEAMRRRDAEEADALMRRHIANVRDVYDQYYGILF